MSTGMLAHCIGLLLLSLVTSPAVSRGQKYCHQRVCMFICVSVCSSVCRFVCPLAYLENRTSKFYHIFAHV